MTKSSLPSLLIKSAVFIIAIVVIMYLYYSVGQGNRDDFVDNNQDNIEIYVGNTRLLADIADSEAEIVEGLSGRDELLSNEAMIFVLPASSRAGFWMKDMKFPIDIIWIDDNKKIVYIENNISPETYPKIFYPDTDALYVLEVAAGFSETNKIDKSTVLRFDF